MIILKIGLFLIMTFLHEASFAKSPECSGFLNQEVNQNPDLTLSQILDLEFKKAFYDPSIYTQGYCAMNVQKFLQHLVLSYPQLDISEIKVLYFKRNKNYRTTNSFYVKQARSQRSRKPKDFLIWDYHVALEYKNKIYDFDYTKKPKPISKNLYLEDMFLSSYMIRLLGLPLYSALEDLEIVNYGANDYLQFEIN